MTNRQTDRGTDGRWSRRVLPARPLFWQLIKTRSGPRAAHYKEVWEKRTRVHLVILTWRQVEGRRREDFWVSPPPNPVDRSISFRNSFFFLLSPYYFPYRFNVVQRPNFETCGTAFMKASFRNKISHFYDIQSLPLDFNFASTAAVLQATLYFTLLNDFGVVVRMLPINVDNSNVMYVFYFFFYHLLIIIKSQLEPRQTQSPPSFFIYFKSLNMMKIIAAACDGTQTWWWSWGTGGMTRMGSVHYALYV